MALLGRAEYEERLRNIRLLVMDCDGVLTDGGILYFDGSLEGKQFHVRDGSAMYITKLIGVRTAVVTARTSAAVKRRFKELPVDYLRQGARQKLAVCHEIQEAEGIEAHQIAYLCDDLIDLPMMEYAGLGVAVADANPQLAARADWVTERRGGRGAVREVVDDLVTARDAWDEVIDDYRRRFSEGAATVVEDNSA